jgi:hypothetical protein
MKYYIVKMNLRIVKVLKFLKIKKIQKNGFSIRHRSTTILSKFNVNRVTWDPCAKLVIRREIYILILMLMTEIIIAFNVKISNNHF